MVCKEMLKWVYLKNYGRIDSDGNIHSGQMIVLKSNRTVEGAVIAVLEGSSETRYQVFTNSLGMQTYYESQIEAKELEESIEEVDGKRFPAGLTASLIRNPSLSSLYSLNTNRFDTASVQTSFKVY